MDRFEHRFEQSNNLEAEQALLQDFLHDPEARNYLLELKDSTRRSFLTVVAVAGIFLSFGGEAFAQAKGNSHTEKTEQVPEFVDAENFEQYVSRNTAYKDSVYQSTHSHLEEFDSAGVKKKRFVFGKPPKQKIAPINKQAFYINALQKQKEMNEHGFRVPIDGIWDKADAKAWQEYRASVKANEDAQIALLRKKLAETP